MQQSVPLFTGKKNKEKLALLTAYDFPTARRLEQAGVDGILVGDSMGMVLYGQSTTLGMTMEILIEHVKAVVRGAPQSLVIADLPFLSYHLGKAQAIQNAGRFLQQAGASAVKLEGGEEVAPVIESISNAGIPVMAHLGLTPQKVHQLGGYKRQGYTEKQRDYLIRSAKAVTQAGAFAVVLECVEPTLAERITQNISIPTIGIGSGKACDGQILVTEDLLGLSEGRVPGFVDPVADLGKGMLEGIQQYVDRTKSKPIDLETKPTHQPGLDENASTH